MRLFQNQDLNEVLGKNLIENPEPHQEPEPHQKSKTSSRTSSKLKILGKTSLRFRVDPIKSYGTVYKRHASEKTIIELMIN